MSLPQEKKDKLAERVKDDIYRELKKHHDDFTRHEVNRDDADTIVSDGVIGGIDKFWTEKETERK